MHSTSPSSLSFGLLGSFESLNALALLHDARLFLYCMYRIGRMVRLSSTPLAATQNPTQYTIVSIKRGRKSYSDLESNGLLG